jgi:prepilin-type N-terminal cleavage/methylation domain-containing protein
MLKKLNKSNKGFTIIEVLIVLAIAALILLIVFLAVPALQRSSRNTQRKNDAAGIGGAIANFVSNNNGLQAKLVSDKGATNTVTVMNTAGGNVETANLGFYTTLGTTPAGSGQDNSIYISAAASPAVPPTVVASGAGESAVKVSTNTVAIIYGQDCTPTGNLRATAVYYVTETGSGNGTLQCIQE